jgi:hypothetical protein
MLIGGLLVVFPGDGHAAKRRLFKNRLMVEASYGYYQIPGQLFELDSSVTEHPPHLLGEIRALRGSYEVSRKWSLGVQAFKIQATGNGRWARSDTPEVLAQNNIAGEILGKTEWELQGITVDVERRFLRGPVNPFVRVGGGLGEVEVKFTGEFRGHETMSGFNFPVVEPARDRIVRKVPIVIAEMGLRFHLTKRLNYSMSGYWNTGYGARLALGARF